MNTNRNLLILCICLAVLLVPLAASAQESGGTSGADFLTAVPAARASAGRAGRGTVGHPRATLAADGPFVKCRW